MATYTNDQLTSYFTRIQYPRESHPTDHLALLSELLQHQLTSIPFETLSLHYSVDKTISLDPEDLFQKIVTRRRGGYCQENNTFFGIVLRSLGFRVYGVICRSSNASRGLPGDGWRAMSHMANIVTVNDQRYMVDVGYGPNGPVVPLLLDPSGLTTSGGMPNQEIKLELKTLPQHSSPSQKVWAYSQKLPLMSDNWIDLYHFPDVEFFLPDFDVLNHYNSTIGHWTKTVIAQRFLWDDEGRILKGNLILLNARVEERMAGEVKGRVVRELESEEERLEALEKGFGIVLRDEEKDGIKGCIGELKSDAL